jgi:hypothetical protein
LEQAEQEYGLEVKLTENHELHQEKYNISIDKSSLLLISPSSNLWT